MIPALALAVDHKLPKASPPEDLVKEAGLEAPMPAPVKVEVEAGPLGRVLAPPMAEPAPEPGARGTEVK